MDGPPTPQQRSDRVARAIAPYIDAHAIDGLRWAIEREIAEAVEAAVNPGAEQEPGTTSKYELRAALMAARDVTSDRTLEDEEMRARVRTLIAPHIPRRK